MGDGKRGIRMRRDRHGMTLSWITATGCHVRIVRNENDWMVECVTCNERREFLNAAGPEHKSAEVVATLKKSYAFFEEHGDDGWIEDPDS